MRNMRRRIRKSVDRIVACLSALQLSESMNAALQTSIFVLLFGEC